MIQSYLDQIRQWLDHYGSSNFVVDVIARYDVRPGDQAYLAGSVLYKDGSSVYFAEFLDTVDGTIVKLRYRYHYQDQDDRLLFRYDNARHCHPNRPCVPSHDGGAIMLQIVDRWLAQQG